ncbi:DUF1678 family protein, partial [Methanopyrus sp.]
RAALKTLHSEISNLPYKQARRELARGLALAFDARPAGSSRIRDLLEGLPRRLESFLTRTLGGWPAHYSTHLRKVIRSRRKFPDGKHEVPDVLLEIERWKLKHGDRS